MSVNCFICQQTIQRNTARRFLQEGVKYDCKTPEDLIGCNEFKRIEREKQHVIDEAERELKKETEKIAYDIFWAEYGEYIEANKHLFVKNDTQFRDACTRYTDSNGIGFTQKNYGNREWVIKKKIVNL